MMQTAVITGGGGFVGSTIVRQLLRRGVACHIIGRNRYPELEKLGARCFRGDIRQPATLRPAFKGADTVFHVAALAGIWGDYQRYYTINTLGTSNVITLCQEFAIPVLVHTSTPSVVFGGEHIEGGDERLAYPDRYLCHYAQTKALAEKMVLAANGSGLRTSALRPHLVWGPEDPHLIPRLLAKGRKGQLKIVGDGTNLVDISYVDDVAFAHILAAENLHSPCTAAGKAYFISQGEPVVLWQWINELFSQVGIPPVRKKVPMAMAYGVGALLEMVYRLLRRQEEPRMTRFLAEQLAKSHYFSLAAARRDLGYSPQVSTADGMKKLVAWIHAQSL